MLENNRDFDRDSWNKSLSKKRIVCSLYSEISKGFLRNASFGPTLQWNL